MCSFPQFLNRLESRTGLHLSPSYGVANHVSHFRTNKANQRDGPTTRFICYTSLPPLGVSVRSPSSPSSAFVPISDKDMTEIELHSVDSISDLHRTHPEQHSKGVRPPRPQPPSINGNLQMIDRPVVCQTGYRMRRSHLSKLSDMWTSSKWRYSLTCVAVMLILLTVILIFIVLVQQSRTLHRLAEVLSQRQETADKTSIIFEELQTLRRNLTPLKIRQ
ncbi:hypothetical protein AMELA_G00263360 [Ameiurus melas]|uniref:Uncharacterized protein n=1 Tax=Ameiurus melas TaxID=219545 RepID=A0A7J5ZPT0_AMEME|nr:hypothetical protein AMELA_G00263360 [Ameiurus melas]